MKKINTDNIELDRVQAYAADAIEPLEKCVLTKGVLVNGVEITAGKIASVHHGLSRKPLGFIVTNRNANAVVWASDSSIPERLLNLNASANCVVGLWIF